MKRQTGPRRGTRRPSGRKLFRTRSAKYKLGKDEKIDYKNFTLLQRYLTERGKIVSRRVSGVTAMQQRQITASIKYARYLGLLAVIGQK